MLKNIEKFSKNIKIYDPGEIIFCEFEDGKDLYYILEGKVKISKISRDTEKIIAYLKTGEFFGEMSIFENKNRTATVIVEEKSKILMLNREEFFSLMELSPDFVLELIKVLSHRYENTLNQLNSINERNFEKKILKYIYTKYLEGKKKGIDRFLEINLKEIMSILNISKIILEKELNSYIRKGLIKISDTTILIKEFGWLELKNR